MVDVDTTTLRSEDDAPFRGGGEWCKCSRLDRGGKVKATGGGDLSRVYGGEEGSGDCDAGELTREETFWYAFSCRRSSLSYVGLPMGETGNGSPPTPPSRFFWLWLL